MKSIIFLFIMIFVHTTLNADGLPSESSAKTRQEQADKSSDKKSDKKKEDKEERVPQRIFSAKEKKEICQKYMGQIVAFYNETWMVEKNCQRRLLSTEELYNYSLKKFRVTNVEGFVLAALDEVDTPNSPKRGCKELDKKYITFSGSGILYVKDCKKYSFQDWESYKDHSKKNKNPTIQALTKEEFEAIEEGGELPSSLDHEYAQYLVSDHVDIIPINKACQGLIGSYVTYLNKVYFIEGKRKEKDALCVKRVVENTVSFFQANPQRIKELQSTQAISIPDGKPHDKYLAKVDTIKK